MPCPNPCVLIQRACSQWWVLTNVRENPELVLETTQKTSRATSVWKRALHLTFNICTSVYEHLVRNPLGWISLFPTCGVDRIRLSINFFFCPECACSIRVCQLGIYWGGDIFRSIFPRGLENTFTFISWPPLQPKKMVVVVGSPVLTQHTKLHFIPVRPHIDFYKVNNGCI